MGGIVFDSSGQEVDQRQKIEKGVPNGYSRTEPYLDEHPDLEPLPGLGQQVGTESSLAAIQGQFLLKEDFSLNHIQTLSKPGPAAS